MARYRIPGKRYTKRSIFGITMIVVAIAAVVAAAIAVAVLPAMVDGHEGSDLAAGTYVRPTVQAIVVENEGRISINADLTQVYATVQYSDGTSEQVALSEMVIEGLDLTSVQTLNNVVLDYGGFKQTVTYEVVPTTLTVTYSASYGGRIEGDTEQSVVAGGDATTVNAVATEGYEFVRWSDGYPEPTRRDREISRTMHITAVFTRQTFTVVFYYPDGTTAREETVFYGSRPTNVPRADESNMQLYGYAFSGWDTDYTNVTEDLNIRPIMVKNAVDLNMEFTTDGNGALGYIEDLEPYYPKGAQSVLRLRANDSRIFTGWRIQNADGEWVSVAPEGVSQQVELAEGTYVMFTSARTGTSEEYTLSFTLPSDSSSGIAGNISSMSIRADFVYAESVISFSSNGAPVSTLPSVTLPYGTPIGDVFDVEDTGVLSLGGFTFGGWYYETDENGDPVILENSDIIERDVTLIAYWIRNEYTVTFTLDGLTNYNDFTTLPGYDSERGVIVVTAAYQTSLAGAVSGAFPSVTPAKADSVFVGWYVTDMGEVTDIAVTGEYVVSASVTVAAVFESETRDMTISLTGAGAVYTVLGGSLSSSPVQGVVKVPLGADFAYAVVPNSGYVLTEVSLNGNVVVSGDDIPITDGMYLGSISADSISAAEALRLEVVFRLRSHAVNVVNGSVGSAGTVEYYVSGTSGDGTWITNTSSAFSVEVPSGGSLVVRITATDGNYISSLAVGSVQETLPTNAESYVFTIPDVTSTTSVEIAYRTLYYTVTMPESVENASVTGPRETAFQKGTNPGNYIVSAAAGYYISAVRINGTVLDPYALFTAGGLTGGACVFAFDVNGVAADGSVSGDYRITRIEFRIESISRDIAAEIETSELYYRINTSYIGGEGSVTESFIVGYGDTAEVIATTDSSYSVASVTVNGEVTSYAGRLSGVTYTTPEVTEDYEIVFTFARTLQTVSFTTNNTGMSLTYDGSAVSVSEVTTIANVPRGSSPVFVITAPADAVLDSITVTTASGESYPEIIGYGVTSHTMTFDGIDSDFTVEVLLSAVTYTAVAVAVDGGGSMVTLAGSSVTGTDGGIVSTGGYEVSYDGSAAVSVTLNNTRELAVSDVEVVNVSGGDYHYIASATGTDNTDSYGVYTFESSGNARTISVYGIRSDIMIYLNFRASTENDILKFAASGEGALTASVNGSPISSGADLTAGTVVEFTALPAAGAALEGYIVNGAFTATGETTYTYTVRDGLNSVYAVFGEIRRYIRVDLSVGSGSVNTDIAYVTDGEGFNIRFIPAAGYSLGTYYVSYGNTSRRDPMEAEIVEYSGGVVEWRFSDGTQYGGDITVHAEFTANLYSLTLEYSSGGSVTGGEQGTNYSYGTSVSMYIAAADGYYIRSVTVAGLSYSPSQLNGAVLDGATNCFTSGTLTFRITGDTHVAIEFMPNSYTMIISDTLGGTTYVMTDAGGGSGYIDTDSLTFGAAENLRLRLNADEGYHIAELIINGTNVWDWQISGVGANEMTEIYYDLGRRSDALSVRVVYEINEYYIDVNAVNTSPNFASRDTDPSTFGSVTLTGYTAGSDGVYEGIAHGADVRVLITPRTSRGYYVETVVIYYTDAGGNTGVTTLSRDQMPETGGAYLIEGIYYDITSLYVEFKRYQYAVNTEDVLLNENLTAAAPGDIFAFTGGMTVTFVNPYDRNAEVVSENGLYEYGLNYTITVAPGTGYERTAFEINGEDRMSSVRNDTLTGVLTADMVCRVWFDITVHDVEFVYELPAGLSGSVSITGTLSGGGTFEWTPETAQEGVYILTDGVVWAEAGSSGVVLRATYGTTLTFTATPEFSECGAVIGSFDISTDGAAGRVDVSDPTAAANVTRAVAGETRASVVFRIMTYTITVEAAEGGNSSVSSATAEWGEDLTLVYELYNGYEVDGADGDDVFTVTVNGEALQDDELEAIRAALFDDAEGAERSYTFTDIRGDYDIVIAPARRKLKAKFTGGYALLHQGTHSSARATARLDISGGASFTSDIFADDEIPPFWTPVGGVGADYDGIRFNDRITVTLVPPEGYDPAGITLTMGETVYTLTDFLYSGGAYSLTLNSVTANIDVGAAYSRRSYEVVSSVNNAGGLSGISVDESAWHEGDTIGHHSYIVIYFTSNPGYYLSQITINGINYAIGYGGSYNVVPAKETGGRYIYTATFVVNDAFVNGRGEISIEAIFSPQSFALRYVINGRSYSDGSGDGTLAVSSEHGLAEYDPSGGTPITHNFTVGYEITGVSVYYSANWQQGSGYIGEMTGVDYGAMTGENQYERRPDEFYTNTSLTMYINLGVKLSGANASEIYSATDIHDPNMSTLYIVYTTALSVYSVELANDTFAYMATDGGETAFTIAGNNPTAGWYPAQTNPIATYTMEFDDNSASLSGHTHGTGATFRVTLSNTADYVFEGFQEYRNGVWSYVRSGVNGITIFSNGAEMRYTMTSTRIFRAVFFRVYSVSVEVMPLYKYISGSFASADPEQMIYRTYASVTAEATYTGDASNPGKLLPDITPGADGVMRETLSPSGTSGASFVFRVPSGAGFVPYGADTSTGTSRANISFYSATPLNQANAFVSGSAVTGDVTMYAADPAMTVYLSFLSESYGATTSNAGGNLNITLSANSYRVTPGSTVSFTVTPNSGYRIESIGYLLDTGEPDANGYRRFTTTYNMLTPGTSQGNFALSAANEANGAVTVTVSPVTENMIIKIRYVKQVTVERSVALFDGKTVAPVFAGSTGFIDSWTNDRAVFDYGSTVELSVNEGLVDASVNNTGLNTRYRFMGYMINGVMQYTELIRSYPASTYGAFVLDDIGGRLNGASLTTVSTSSGTEYVAYVTALFEPVYTIVVENVYNYEDDSGVWRYESAGDVVVTTTQYNSDRPQYYSSSTQVEGYLGVDSTKSTIQVLEQINGMTGSAYNTWNDNTITLMWSGTGAEEGFTLQGWQYYYYRGEQLGWGWGFIPDANGDTSAATYNNFTFPVSVLYDNSYMPYISTGNTLPTGGSNDAHYAPYTSFTDPESSGEYVYGDVGAYCIVIRPLFRKQNRLSVVTSVAIQEAGAYVDNAAGPSPTIDGTAYPEASFDAGTSQTIRSNNFEDYIFDGWYVTSTSGARAALQQTGAWEEIAVDGAEVPLEYRYNADGTLNVIMNDSYIIYARYTRKYEINVSIRNDSGDAASLNAILPYLNAVYRENSADTTGTELTADTIADLLQGSMDSRSIMNATMPVGSTLTLTMDFSETTTTRGDITKFNPIYDRLSAVSVTDNGGNELFNTSSAFNDAPLSSFDAAYFTARRQASSLSAGDYADYIAAIEQVSIVITANTAKRVNINFISYGELVIHNVYNGDGNRAYGSGLRLPADFAAALGQDSAAASDYWVYDGGNGDSDGEVNGEISIVNIPISSDANYDKQSSADFWVRIQRGGSGMNLTIDTSDQLTRLNFSMAGVDIPGSGEYFVKIQHVFFYDDPEADPYSYTSYDGTDFVEHSNVAAPEGIIDFGYPFAGGIGTDTQPLLISTAEQLEGLNNIHRGMDGNLSGVYFAIDDDIDLSRNFTGMIGEDFTNAAGSLRTNGFTGILDGRDHTLYNMGIGGNDYAGLFSKLGAGSEVSNLYISGSASGGTYVGLLAGELYSGKVTNVNGIALTNGSASSIVGDNYVGGLVGYARGTSSQRALIVNSSFVSGLVSARSGGSFDSVSFAYAGGAGGIAGSLGEYASITGNATIDTNGYVVSGTSGVTNVTIVSSIASGQIAGSLINASSSDAGAEITGMIADSVNYDSTDNLRAVGGIAGSVGTYGRISSSYYVVDGSASIYSSQANGSYSNFDTPERNAVYQLGAGAITGRNLGTISSSYVVSADGSVAELNITGAFIGGIAGVNIGTITDSGVANVKLYSDRSNNVLTAIGGIAGVNWENGTISGGGVFMSAGDAAFTRDNAAIELTTGNLIYDIANNYATEGTGTGGGLPNVYEAITVADTSNVYISLGAGFNSGTVTDGSYTGKLLLNRRTNDLATGATYAGGVTACNDNGTVTGATVNTNINVFHYIYVDAGTRDNVEAPQRLYVGRAYGGGTAIGAVTISGGAVNVIYLGAGEIYSPADAGHILAGHHYGKGAQEGAATVYCSEGTGSVNATTLVAQIPTNSDLESFGSGTPWISDFVEHAGAGWGGNDWIASTTNYNGFGRYISVSVN